MPHSTRTHFILTKQESFTPSGQLFSATEAALTLLKRKEWPLFSGTRCRHMVRPGHRVLVYTAGSDPDCRRIIASARVADVVSWKASDSDNYPIILDGVPEKSLVLDEIEIFEPPVDFLAKLDDLSFIPENRKKWGVAMMGGMRSIELSDFKTLTPDI